ncbi:MAG: hypothetical protein F4X12_03455 [Acidobacteriia bacterium]|nr:hypothetical protein [Terriglobia bacterium]
MKLRHGGHFLLLLSLGSLLCDRAGAGAGSRQAATVNTTKSTENADARACRLLVAITVAGRILFRIFAAPGAYR